MIFWIQVILKHQVGPVMFGFNENTQAGEVEERNIYVEVECRTYEYIKFRIFFFLNTLKVSTEHNFSQVWQAQKDAFKDVYLATI